MTEAAKKETIEQLKLLDQKGLENFVRNRLTLNFGNHIRYIDKDILAKEHYRFDMTGYESGIGENTLGNMAILNMFAYLGLYDYTHYLYLDFYKGCGTLYWKYWNSRKDEEAEFGGWGTVEIITNILHKTVLSGRVQRRRG